MIETRGQCKSSTHGELTEEKYNAVAKAEQICLERFQKSGGVGTGLSNQTQICLWKG